MKQRPPHKLYACLNDDGTAMYETVLTEAEYATPVLRAAAEAVALRAADCSRVTWADVTDNDAFWDDPDNPDQ